MANKLQIFNGKITGKVDMPLGWDKIGCYCKISVCKRYHLEKSTDQFCVPIENTLWLLAIQNLISARYNVQE